MPNKRDAVLGGSLEAARLLKQVQARERVPEQGRIDVFSIIVELGVPLVFKPLDGLLGAFLFDPSPGILVTTERPLSIQRYTAAHELGHYFMGHRASLDDEGILRGSPFVKANYSHDEVAANTFAAMFLMPDWLLNHHAKQQGWTADSLQDPTVVYQMSLRVGTSYESTCRVLERHGFITPRLATKLLDIPPKDTKKKLLGSRSLSSWRPNVWMLTERDSGTTIYGEPEDLFVVKLKEHSGAGYLWNLDQVKAAGFNVVSDERLIPDSGQDIGGEVERVLTAQSKDDCEGSVELIEARPWDPDDAMARLSFSYEFHRERGMSRTARERISAA